ncbi:protein tyrosine phosphatase receptor type C-associated protein [Anolis carolinensis]|uniref:protein tyrosine phosphatase receptor type C-associated protein n=1 Tax=Anolis carolinensis TaxID=28377 RepID=UPI0002038197|nr:PREDICTED: protein tyrosine phosphatase receptor type C-associated protein [Anolis carolinensis]|eukprot:XP_003215021.1 PREDICTED: protein tyrosine phosphatase receptor type C-associated protein [Anolis carolinensis]
MMRPSFTHALLAVFLLTPGEAHRANTQKSGNGNRRNNITVSLLVCLLLLLLILLFLAWRYLNRKSEGQYHPQRLMRSLVFRWQEFWGQTHSEELTHGDHEENQSDEESKEQHDDDDEDEDEEHWNELLLQRAGSECEEEKQERLDKSASPKPLEKKAELESEEDDNHDRASRATEGRAETLLSDLHSFSGTATWEDSGKPAHVTAL